MRTAALYNLVSEGHSITVVVHTFSIAQPKGERITQGYEYQEAGVI